MCACVYVCVRACVRVCTLRPVVHVYMYSIITHLGKQLRDFHSSVSDGFNAFAI